MTEQCKYVSKDAERKEWYCAITGKYCIAASDASGNIDPKGYMSESAKLCPAFNLEKSLAKSLQITNLDRQRLGLADKLDKIE